MAWGATFTFAPGLTLRTITKEGEPWSVTKNIYAVVGVDQAHKAVQHLDEDEKDGNSVPTPGGPRKVIIVNESSLYSLILKSRMPEAKAFKKWVTSVVSSIRIRLSLGW